MATYIFLKSAIGRVLFLFFVYLQRRASSNSTKFPFHHNIAIADLSNIDSTPDVIMKKKRNAHFCGKNEIRSPRTEGQEPISLSSGFHKILLMEITLKERLKHV